MVIQNQIHLIICKFFSGNQLVVLVTELGHLFYHFLILLKLGLLLVGVLLGQELLHLLHKVLGLVQHSSVVDVEQAELLGEIFFEFADQDVLVCQWLEELDKFL